VGVLDAGGVFAVEDADVVGLGRPGGGADVALSQVSGDLEAGGGQGVAQGGVVPAQDVLRPLAGVLGADVDALGAVEGGDFDRVVGVDRIQVANGDVWLFLDGRGVPFVVFDRIPEQGIVPAGVVPLPEIDAGQFELTGFVHKSVNLFGGRLPGAFGVDAAGGHNRTPDPQGLVFTDGAEQLLGGVEGFDPIDLGHVQVAIVEKGLVRERAVHGGEAVGAEGNRRGGQALAQLLHVAPGDRVHA